MGKLMVNKSFLCYYFLKQQIMLKWKLRKSKKKKKRKKEKNFLQIYWLLQQIQHKRHFKKWATLSNYPQQLWTNLQI